MCIESVYRQIFVLCIIIGRGDVTIVFKRKEEEIINLMGLLLLNVIHDHVMVLDLYSILACLSHRRLHFPAPLQSHHRPPRQIYPRRRRYRP